MVVAGDVHIQVSSSNIPMSNTGPCLASDGSRLYMAYISHTDSSLFFAWCDNKSGNFSDWQGNVKILINGVTANSNVRPALVVYQGQPLLLFVSLEGDLAAAFFDGNMWQHLNVKVPDISMKVGVLSAVVSEGQIFPAMHATTASNPQGLLFYLQGQTVANSALNFTTELILAAQSNPQHLSIGATPSFPYCLNQNTTGPTNYFTLNGVSPWGLVEPGSGSPTIGFGAAIIWWSNQIEIIYQGTGNAVFAASFKSILQIGPPSANNQNMLLNPSVPITSKSGSSGADTAGGIVRTNAPLSAIVHQNNICIAHKGAYSSNLYLAYAHA